MNQLESFRRLAEDSRFREWLTREREQTISYLADAVPVHVIHRAQGQLQLLDKMIELIEKAKVLR